MNAEKFRNFMGYLWYQKEDDVYTIGINEEGVEQISEITAMDLPAEGEDIDPDLACGSIDTEDGLLDIYSPVSGTVLEVNLSVVENPSLLQEDPYDSWLLRIQSDEDEEDLDEDEEDTDDEDMDEEEDDADDGDGKNRSRGHRKTHREEEED